MNLFIAIELPIPVVETLALLQEELSDPVHHLGCDVRWTPADEIRLVLKGLPDFEPDMLPRLREALRVIAKVNAEFDLAVEGTRFYPSEDVPRMILARARSEQIGPLRGQLEAACEGLGLPKDAAPYEPHVLVGRLLSPHGAPTLRGVLNAYEATPYGDGRVRELVLVETARRGEVAETRVLNRFALGSGT